MGEITSHAPFAPSSMELVVRCFGSFNLRGLTPQVETDESREGTAAHLVMSHLLETGEMMEQGASLPDGFVVNVAMQDGAQMYADHVIASTPPTRKLHIEKRVICSIIHDQCWGTPDTWSFNDNVLDVFDYKFGHRYVDPFENWQILAYVWGILDDELHIDALAEQFITVRAHVIQPRSYHREGPIRTWTAKASALRAHLNIMQGACFESLKPNAKTTPGRHCRDCHARHRCEALQTAAYDVASYVEGSNIPLDITAGSLGRELETLQLAQKVLKARITGLEAQAIAELFAGKPIPQFQLESTKPHRRWKEPVSVVTEMGQMFGVSLVKPTELVTPSRAKAMGIDESVILEYAEYPRGQLKLVPADTTQLRKLFS